MTDFIPRELSDSINEALKEMPVVVLTGLRQSGKTTFLKKDKVLSKRKYFTFDDWNTVELAKTNPEIFLEDKGLITIDEVQKNPDIIPYIKQEVDKGKIKGKFLLSGSANLSLLQRVTESLAGRAIYLTMNPLTLREIQKEKKHSFLEEIFLKKELKNNLEYKSITDFEILLGGMPSPVIEKINPEIWWKGYIQTYLERDVRDFGRIHDFIPFKNLISLLAFRCGGILNVADIARDSKLNTATATKYLNILEASFLVNSIPPYLKNPASRIIKSPKVYLSDSGLNAYLSGIRNSKSPLYLQKKGNLLETFVLHNLMGITSILRDITISYWNVQGRYEVDFILEQDNSCIAIEVKASSRIQGTDLYPLKKFMELTPSCFMGILAYNGTKILQLDKHLYAVPIRLLLK